MKLAWFRRHKQFVYWILLPVVGIGMAFFGVTSIDWRGGLGSGATSIQYRSGDDMKYMGPTEVMTYRHEILNYYAHGQRGTSKQEPASSAEAAWAIARYHAALDAGLETGTDEMKATLRDIVKVQIQKFEQKINPEEIVADDATYQKLLKKINMTSPQFERMAHQQAVTDKYADLAFEQDAVTEQQLYVAYCLDKELVRLRYKEFKSEDYLARAKIPASDEISKLYDNLSKNKDQAHNWQPYLINALYSKPMLSADVFCLDREHVKDPTKPDEEVLKKFYDSHKKEFWKDGDTFKPFDSVKDEVPAKWKATELKDYYDRFKDDYWKLPVAEATTEKKYKPLADVKADVEAKWTEDMKNSAAQSQIITIWADERTAERKWKDEQEKTPAADQKPFDLVAWAKTKDLTHWVTDMKTEEEYKKGKREVGAKDAVWVKELFPRRGESAEEFKNRVEELSIPVAFDPMDPGQGMVMMRRAKFEDKKLKTLDQAKPAITALLKAQDAAKLAQEDANKVHDEWVKSGVTQPVNTLEEVTGNSKSTHNLVLQYLSGPKARGEILDVAAGEADKSDPENPNVHFYLGFAVDVKPPAWASFEQNTEWRRNRERSAIAQSDRKYLQSAMFAYFGGLSKVIATAPDQSLFGSVRQGGGPADDGGY